MQDKTYACGGGQCCPLRGLSPYWRSGSSNGRQTELNPPMAVFVKPVRCAVVRCAAERQRMRLGGACSGSTRAVFGVAIKATRGRYKRGRQAAVFGGN